MVKQEFAENDEVPFLSEEEVLRRWTQRPSLEGPYSVYSSWAGGWTESRAGLAVGLDDHGFHRGDGVFEAVKVVGRKPWLLEPHWLRLQKSMSRIGIELPLDFGGLTKILQAGLARFPDENMILRIFVTRGPGGFSTDARESKGAQLYLVLMRFRPVAEENYRFGVRVGKSRIPVKSPWLAVTKSLNYLPNVMMKKEAVDRGLDFVVSFDEDGLLAESATENLVLLKKDGKLAFPRLDKILRGCTMLRLFELVEARDLLPTEKEFPLTEKDLLEAQGAWMVGTTLDALPVAEYEGHRIPLGPWAQKLREWLREDQTSN